MVSTENVSKSFTLRSIQKIVFVCFFVNGKSAVCFLELIAATREGVLTQHKTEN